MPLLVDLVQVVTRDGVRLDGAYHAPAGKPVLSVDGVCVVHGTGGNFYGSSLFDALTERLQQLGCGVLRVNTRGHDGISTAVTPRGGRRLGAAYETIDDCRHDLAAWVEWLRGAGGSRVGLVGHSMGAVKCVYALAHEPALAAACLVALSPPRLSYGVFAASPARDEFLRTYRLADEHVAAGRPGALLEVSFPLPMVIAAAGYLEKYGPDERYNVERFLPGVPCPSLLTFGSLELESNPAFRRVPEELRPLCDRHPRFHIEIVEGADHFYSAARTAVVDRVIRWMESPGPSTEIAS